MGAIGSRIVIVCRTSHHDHHDYFAWSTSIAVEDTDITPSWDSRWAHERLSQLFDPCAHCGHVVRRDAEECNSDFILWDVSVGLEMRHVVVDRWGMSVFLSDCCDEF